MPTIIIRPNSTVSVGNFSNSTGGAIFHNFINDQNDATFTNNTRANEVFTVGLDDVSLSGATFNSFVLTTRTKKGGKGNAEWNAQLQTSGGSALCNDNFTSTSSSYADFNSSSTSFSGGFSESDVNGLKVRIETINNRQCFFAEVFVTIDYTAAVSGYGHDVNSVGSSSIGKINSVATASIGKVNSVD